MSCCCNKPSHEGFLDAEGLQWYSTFIKKEFDRVDNKIDAIDSGEISSRYVKLEDNVLTIMFNDGTRLEVNVGGGGGGANLTMATIAEIDALFEGRL